MSFAVACEGGGNFKEERICSSYEKIPKKAYCLAAEMILRRGIYELGSPGKTRKPGKVTVRWRKHPRISSL